MRRAGLVYLVLSIFLVLAAACQPAAAPAAPTAAPAAPTAAPAAPAAPTAAAPAAPTAAAPAAAATTAPAAAGNAPTEIKVGAITGLTGPLAGFGAYFKFAYGDGVDDINKAGGVMVKQYGTKIPIKLIFYDDQGKPELDTQLMERLINQDKVVAVLGPGGPPDMIPAAVVAERYKIPMIGGPCPGSAFAAGAPQGGWHYVWDLFFNEDQMASIQFQLMDTVQSNKKAVLFTDNEGDGVAQGDAWEKNGPKAGYQIALRSNFPVGTTDFADMIRKSQATGADIMIAQMLPPDAVTLWRQMQSYKWKPKAAFIEKGSEPYEFWKSLGASAEGVMVTGFWHPAMGYPGAADLRARFEKETGQPYSQHIMNIALPGILAKAIEMAGTLNPEDINNQVIAAAASQTWVAGDVKYDPKTHYAAMPVSILQWRNGETNIVFPKDKANKDFLYPLPAW